MLSNTATPKYYGEFREAVLAGELPICREISMEMNRIDALIENPNYYYDDEAIDGFISFCEDEMTLVDGDDLTLLPSFRLWAEQLLSWYYLEEEGVYDPEQRRVINRNVYRRLRNKQYLIVARGSAKSMYAAMIQAYFLLIDTSTTHQVVTAPVMRQTQETLDPIMTAISRHKGPLLDFLAGGSNLATRGSLRNRAKLASSRDGIHNFLTKSKIEARPMMMDRLQGLRNKITTVDEWLSGDTREDVIGALEQGASKIPDYVIVAISSEGMVRNGVGDNIKMELHRYLRGEEEADHVSIFHYKLDDISEVGDPEMWIKANPNLGITVQYSVYHKEVKKAESNPAARNDILAKRFGIPTEGYTYFFTYEETIPRVRKHNYDGMICSLGIDLSQGDDFCAFTFLFPLSVGFGVKTLSFISRRTYDKLPSATRAKYDEFLRESTLMVHDGGVLDMMEVYDDVEKFIEQHNYIVVSVGFDPYNAHEFIARWCQENGDYAVEKVIQGVKTESVPLGEIKKLANDSELIFDESLMSYTMGNAVVQEDTNGNRKLLKKRYEYKIDNVSALMDAYVAYRRNPDAFD